VRPFGSVPEADSVSATPPSEEKVWTSMTSQNVYKIRIDGDYVYVETINLPPTMQANGGFNKAELKKAGGKWVGKKIIYAPFSNKTSTKWCRIEVDVEIDKLSDSRIEGTSLGFSSVNMKTCQPEKGEVRPFTLIPK
jgi:hypothetical protein